MEMKIKEKQEKVRLSLKNMFNAESPNDRRETKRQYDESVRELREAIEDRDAFQRRWSTKELLEAQEKAVKGAIRLNRVEAKLRVSTDTAEIKDLEAEANWCKVIVRQSNEILEDLSKC